MFRRKVALVIILIIGLLIMGCNSPRYQVREINLPGYTPGKDMIIWKDSFYYTHVDDYILGNEITNNYVYRIALSDMDKKTGIANSDIHPVFQSNIPTKSINFIKKKDSLYFNTLRRRDLDTFKMEYEMGKEVLPNHQIVDFDFWGNGLIISSQIPMEVNNNLYIFKTNPQGQSGYSSDYAQNISCDPNLCYKDLYTVGDSLYTSAVYRYSSSEGYTGYHHLYKLDLNTKNQVQLSSYPLQQFIIEPEHKTIYFLSGDRGKQNISGYLYSMDLDGMNVKQLSTIKADFFTLATDEKTKVLELYCFASENNKNKLYRINLNTGDAKLLLTLNSPFDEKQFKVANGYIAITLVNQLGFIVLDHDGQMLYSTNDPVVKASFNGNTAIYSTYNEPENKTQVFKVDLLP